MKYSLICLFAATGILTSACGGGGSSTPPPPIASTALIPDCSGANCGATSPTSYKGSGTGVWKYVNTSAADVTVNIDISGLTTDTQVSLIYTNGKDVDTMSTPNNGSTASFDISDASSPTAQTVQTKNAKQNPAVSVNELPESHSHQLALLDTRNALKRLASNESTAKVASQATPYKAAVLNSTRTWIDYFAGSTGTAYATTNKFMCALPNGRNIVFWHDGSISASNLSTLTTASCGASGGFARIIALLGQPWGTHTVTSLITETPTNLQDINVVLINAVNSDWGGYFGGRNNYIKSASYPSNEALVFFVNTKFLLQGTPINSTASTLFHEATHMINFYQNGIIRRKSTESWLEETSATMSEDIIASPVTGYNRVAISRIPGYLRSGGDVSLNKWVTLDTNHYYMGGALGAFMNRQYGLAIYQQLITGCTSGSALTNSYACLDSLIVNNGGIGLSDTLSKMGASAFGAVPSATAPLGYGFPAKSDNGYMLEAIDVGAAVAPVALTSFKSMSHTYLNDSVSAGFRRYTRSSVRVPANTQLTVVVRS